MGKIRRESCLRADRFFFFFQAEDGIRDLTVTGVQTCALPIWMTFTIEADRFLHRMVRFLVGAMVDIALGRRPLSDLPHLLTATNNQAASPPEIGRASCRERV